MTYVISLINVFKELNYILTKEEKRSSFLVLFMAIISAFIELLGISILIPLIQVFIDVEQVLDSDYAITAMNLFGIDDGAIFILCLFAVVIFIFFIKNLFGVFNLYLSAKFSSKVLLGLGTRMMQVYINREYPFYTNTNISELHRGINTDAVRVYELLNSLINFFKSILLIFVMFMYLIYTNWEVTFGIIIICLVLLYAILSVSRKIARKNGELNRKYSALSVKNVIEAFSGIKEIIVLRKQNYFVNIYKDNFAKVQKTQIRKTMAEGITIYILEPILVGIIVGVMAVVYIVMDDISSIVPIIGAFAYAGMKIIPLLSGLAGMINTITFQRISLKSVYDAFVKMEIIERDEQKKYNIDTGRAVFNELLEFKNVYWTYNSDDNYVLKNLSLKIRKGEAIAFIGKSGAGKSTIVDIILGLFIPQNGQVLIDGVDICDCLDGWKNMVGYVPQSNFLLDDTIRHNIAFGMSDEEIDEDKVLRAIKKSQLESYIDSLPEGLDTMVGERGVRLSGGQRQRIVIARALYNEPSVLILDEATSALDGETEAAVVSALDNLKKELTLIVVAHRLSTIENCDHIYEIIDGNVIEKNKDELFIK